MSRPIQFPENPNRLRANADVLRPPGDLYQLSEMRQLAAAGQSTQSVNPQVRIPAPRHLREAFPPRSAVLSESLQAFHSAVAHMRVHLLAQDPTEELPIPRARAPAQAGQEPFGQGEKRR